MVKTRHTIDNKVTEDQLRVVKTRHAIDNKVTEDQLRVVKTRHAIDNKVTAVLWQTIKEHMIKSVKEYLLMVSGETSAVSLRKIFASLQVL